MSHKQDHISICVCTYKRPELLARLLKKLENLLTEGLFIYSVVVVDNDFKRTAQEVVKEYEIGSSINIEYHVEPAQNIALARNRAIESAKGDFIAFIDDDEFPEATWLLSLYKACNNYKTDGTLGPVNPHFDKEPPKWILKGKFCERPSYKTGTLLNWDKTRTGNVLLRRNIFKNINNRFRAELGRTGGEDMEFFKKIIMQGFTFIWCEDAPVYETVPPERWKRFFYFRKLLRIGTLTGEKMRRETLSEYRYRSLIEVFLKFAIYIFSFPFSLLLGEHVYTKCLTMIFYYFGCISGFCGISILRDRDEFVVKH